MSAGKALLAQGKFTGSTSAVVLNLPFEPLFMQFYNAAGDIAFWSKGMPTGYLSYGDANAAETTNGPVVSGTTVTMNGTEAIINANTVDCRWIAFGL